MADQTPMPVPGDKTAAEQEGARGTSGRAAGGESGGGAYPNPHQAEGGDEGGHDHGFMGHGGQSDIDYHGPEQLGDQKVGDRDNPNAATSTD